jgi:hypothetical protein
MVLQTDRSRRSSIDQVAASSADHAVTALPRHWAKYWSKAMAKQDFSSPDRIDPIAFNRALWRGLKAGVPYPGTAVGTDRTKDEQ